MSIISQNRDVNSAISAPEWFFPHRKVEEQPNKKPKKGGDKSAVAVVKDVRQLGCVLQDTKPQSSSIFRKGTKVLGPIRRVRFTRATLRHAHIRENKGPSLNYIQVKLPHQRRIGLRRRLKDMSDAPAETRGDWPKNIYKLKETDKTTFFSPTNEWRLPAPCKWGAGKT